MYVLESSTFVTVGEIYEWLKGLQLKRVSLAYTYNIYVMADMNFGRFRFRMNSCSFKIGRLNSISAIRYIYIPTYINLIYLSFSAPTFKRPL